MRILHKKVAAATVPARVAAATVPLKVAAATVPLKVAAATVAVAMGMSLLAPPAHADSVRGSEWWLSALKIQQAWSVSQGAGVKIGLIDSGVDATHPDLRGSSFVDGRDFSGKGAPNGLKPVGDPRALAEGPDGQGAHGTAMAGFMVGQGHGAGHASGVLGVAPKASVISASVAAGSLERADYNSTLVALKWAIDHGAKVLDMSSVLGEPGIYKYAQLHDVVIVQAAGNDNLSTLTGAATIFGVVAVGGIDPDLKINAHSDHGLPLKGQVIDGQALPPSAGGLAVMGPWGAGGNTGVPAVVPGGGYLSGQGTSNAAAVVAGVVALIRAKYPKLDAANVINRLIKTATPPTDGSKVPSAKYGFGVVDAYRALTADVPTVTANPLGSIVTGAPGLWAPTDPRNQTPTASSSASQPGAAQSGTAASGAGQPSTGAPAHADAAAKSSGSKGVLVVLGLLVLLALIVGGALLARSRHRSDQAGGDPASSDSGSSDSGSSAPAGYAGPPPSRR